MSFWDSKNLPIYNLKGGFMLPENGFSYDFVPGSSYLNLPNPPTSTHEPVINNDKKSIRESPSDTSSDSDDKKSVSNKTEVCSPCSPSDVDKGDDCEGCDGWFKKARCNVSKIYTNCDKKDVKDKYLKYKKKYINIKYNIYI